MFNIENVYYTLNNLLCSRTNYDVQTLFFYPPGTKNVENIRCYNNNSKFKDNPTVLFYDQEPIDKNVSEDVWQYLPTKHIYPGRVSKGIILANSELNSIQKNKLIQEHNYTDFYYFFHGFAALDWYRGHQHINVNKNYKFDFLVNSKGINGTRTYRLYLISLLKSKGLLANNLFSLQSQEDNQSINEIVECEKFFNQNCKNLIKNQLGNLNLDVYYDDHHSSEASAELNDTIYSTIRYQIVTETVFYDNRLHLTEKTFQPIVTKTPFMLAAGKDSLAYLKDYGFKDYSEWLHVDDTSRNWKTRLESITNMAETFSKLPVDEKDDICLQMQKVAEYNYNHFYGDFFDIIYKEMLDNFDRAWATACARIPDYEYPNNE